jgi:putative membrane protein
VVEPGVEDATRRTRLANERTYLAWWRTGLTALAVAIGIGKVVPATADVRRWPYELVGSGFGVLGIVFVVAAYRRARRVEAALDRGDFARLDERFAFSLTLAGVLLGAATIVLVLFAR